MWCCKDCRNCWCIFNHKDDKKGHHDLFHSWWWEHVSVPFTFPDTLNNQFRSYCDAAAALILNGEEFKLFLEGLCINKQNSTLNHMETNLWNALHCSSTATELAVMAIYAECVSYPYMKSIWTSSEKNQNMLDLGPLHSWFYEHIQKIIKDPDMLITNLDPSKLPLLMVRCGKISMSLKRSKILFLNFHTFMNSLHFSMKQPRHGKGLHRNLH